MPKTASPRCLVAHSSEDSIQLRFRVSDPVLRPASNAGVTYHRLDLEKTRPYGVPGLPEVPVITTYIAVPACDSVTLEAQIAVSHVVNGVNVYPQPAYVLQNPGDGYPSERFTIDAATYARDAEFPGVPGRVVSVQYMRGQALAKVELYPVQFNPVRQQVRVLEDVNVRLRPVNPRGPLRVEAGPLQGVLDAVVPNLGSSGGAARASSGGGGSIRMTAGSGRVCWCESQSNNWQAAAAYVDENCAPDYLMLVADELLADANDSSLVQQLADKRAEYNGFNVAILRMGQIDDSPDITQTPPLIRNFVKAVYDSAGAAHMADGRLGYVLLVGDAYNPADVLLIPTFYFTPSDPDLHSEWGNGADTYYTLLTGNPFSTDLVPDVLLGRLPVDADGQNWEMENVVSKTVTYEPLSTAAAWVDSILLVSAGSDLDFTFQGEGLDGFTAYFNAVSQSIPASKLIVQMHRLAVGSSYSFSNSVAQAIAGGYWVLGIFDHANPVSFENAFYPIHYDTLQNQDKLPFAFTMGSHAGYFDLRLSATQWCVPSPSYPGLPCEVPPTPIDSMDALAERLFVQPAGAIGVVAYARTNGARTTQRAFANLFEAVFHYNASTMGQVLVTTKLLTDDHIVTKNLNLLGDPAVNVMWQFSDLGDDSVDVAVSREGIAFPTAVNTYAATGSTQEITVQAKNLWKDSVTDVPVEIWDGYPGSQGATEVASGVIDSVPAFGSTSWTATIGTFAAGEHDIYVTLDPERTLSEPTTSNNTAFNVLHVREYSTGFPVLLDFSPNSPITLADVIPETGPRKEEILVGSRCYSSTGQWQWTSNYVWPPIGNLFRDGTMYGVSTSSGPSLIIGDASDGTLHALYGLPSGATVESRLLLDHGATDSLEIALLLKTASERVVQVYRADGDLLWETAIGSPIPIVPVQEGIQMAAGDLDGDGTVDLVCAMNFAVVRDSLIAISASGRLWSAPLDAGLPSRILLRLADLDDDGALEVIVNSRDDAAKEHRLHAIGSAGEALWTPPVVLGPDPLSTIRPAFCIGDLDNDRTKECIYVAGDSLGVINASGTIVRVHQLGSDTVFVSSPVIGDIDGDDYPEIITFTRSWEPYLNRYGLEMQIWDRYLNRVGDAIGFPTVSNVGADPALADIDGDQTMEVVFATPDRALHAIDIGTSAGRVEWGQVYGNPMHTNLYEQPIEGTYEGPVALVNRVRVRGDVTFQDKWQVTAPAEVVIDADATDALVRAEAEVSIVGMANDSIRFYLDPLASGGSEWGGIRIAPDDPETPARLKYMVLTDAAVGLECSTQTAVSYSRISGSSSTGVMAYHDITMRGTTVSGGGATGLYVDSAAVATIDRCYFDFNGGIGISAYKASEESVIDSSTCADNGMEGIKFCWMSGGTVSSCILQDNATGGIRLEWATATIEKCLMDHSGLGCFHYANPQVSKTKFIGGGVIAVYNGRPVLGDGGASSGHNCFTNIDNYYITNMSEEVCVPANYNKWGKGCCVPSKFYGCVDCVECDATCQAAPPGQLVAPFGGAESGDTPAIFALRPVAPNPFNPVTVIRYEVPSPGARVRIVVYDVAGRRVADLVDEHKGPGRHAVHWDGTERRGGQVASGVYFVRMTAGRFQQTVKAVVLK